MSEIETTIGFDLRSIAADPSWTANRRAHYLLRGDVAAVRSVDPTVWERPPGFLRSPEMPGLWSKLSDLLASPALGRADVVAIRITAFEEEDEPTQESADAVGLASARYELLGYDVADYVLLGGLTNCGYEPGEAEALAPTWAPRLNQWHLFDNAADATEFATVTDQRVPEHAPFYAYGIYRVS